MTRTWRIYQMHMRDRWLWHIVPLLIIGLSFIVNWMISLLMQDVFYTGGYASMFIYIFIIGILLIPQTFPLAIGLGTTRKDYFLGTLLHSLTMGALTSLILVLLGLLELATDFWGSGLHFFQLPYLHDGPVWVQFLIALLLYLFMFHGGLVIASLYRRFGGKSVLGSILLGIIALTVATYYLSRAELWEGVIGWFAKQTALDLALWTFPFTVLAASASYLMLRRSEV